MTYVLHGYKNPVTFFSWKVPTVLTKRRQSSHVVLLCVVSLIDAWCCWNQILYTLLKHWKAAYLKWNTTLSAGRPSSLGKWMCNSHPSRTMRLVDPCLVLLIYGREPLQELVRGMWRAWHSSGVILTAGGTSAASKAEPAPCQLLPSFPSLPSSLYSPATASFLYKPGKRQSTRSSRRAGSSQPRG